MKITYLALSLGVSLALAGCATTGPTFATYKGDDASCIVGDNANVIRFFSQGEAHVHILEIDGVPTGSRGNPLRCVPPGKHQLGVPAVNNYKEANEYVDLEFEPHKTYTVRANLQGISFGFRVLDITGGQEVLLREFRAKISGSSPAPVPIIIPAR